MGIKTIEKREAVYAVTYEFIGSSGLHGGQKEIMWTGVTLMGQHTDSGVRYFAHRAPSSRSSL